jgi:galactokinase
MEKAIDILEMEIDSMKDAYKQDDRDACKREYAERILSCKKAIKYLKTYRNEKFTFEFTQKMV